MDKLLGISKNTNWSISDENVKMPVEPKFSYLNVMETSGRIKFNKNVDNLIQYQGTQEVNDTTTLIKYAVIGFDKYNIFLCDTVDMSIYRIPTAGGRPSSHMEQLWNSGLHDIKNYEEINIDLKRGKMLDVQNLRSQFFRNKDIVKIIACFKPVDTIVNLQSNETNNVFKGQQNFKFYVNELEIQLILINNNVLYKISSNKFLIPQSFTKSCTHACVNMLASDNGLIVDLFKQDNFRRDAEEVYADVKIICDKLNIENKQSAEIFTLKNSIDAKDQDIFWEQLVVFIKKNKPVIGTISDTEELMGGHCIMIDDILDNSVVIREPFTAMCIEVNIDAVKPYLRDIIGIKTISF